jgi:hypothetical protein
MDRNTLWFLASVLVVLLVHALSWAKKQEQKETAEDPKKPGPYDVDIQAGHKWATIVKAQYWIKAFAGILVFMGTLYAVFRTQIVPEYAFDIQYPIGFLPGFYWSVNGVIFGIIMAASLGYVRHCYVHLFKRFTRFHCPSKECSIIIDTWKPWLCPYCPPGQGVNDGTKRSFFKKCMHCGKKPDAYQHSIATCGFVFELIPGGRLIKYAKEPGTNFPPRFSTALEVPAEPVNVEEPPFIPHGIPFDKRFEHVLIVAETGWGKTWLLKTLSYHDIQAHHSVTVVDSEGGYAESVLGLRNKGDVIYIDFTDPENVPCLSLFDVKLGSDPRERERVFMQTVSLYLYVFSSLMSSKLTDNQTTMLKNLCAVMMTINGSNLRTIKDFIFDTRPFQEDIRRVGGDVATYFTRDWHTKEVGEVKQQVMRRLNIILSDPVLSRVFTQSESKIDLYRAINQGKVIVVNVNRSHLGKENCSILGRFFIAALFRAALRRKEGEDHTPAFLFVDEAWRYFDDDLQEMYETARKRRLCLVLATQQIQHFKNVSMSLKNAAFGSAIKFIGGTSSDSEDAEAMKELGLDPKFYKANKDLQQTKESEKLYASEFYCRVRGQAAKKVKISYADVQNAPRLTKEEFKELLEENNGRYCERVRVRGVREPKGEETVLEPDEHGVLRPKELPRADRSDEFWQ